MGWLDALNPIKMIGNIFGQGGLGGIFDTQSPGFQTTSFPGSYQAGADPARLSKMMESLIGGGNPYASTLSGAINNPSYGPTNANEENLLNSLMSLTQGQSALRGLGPSTQEGMASAIAPTLVNLKEQNIQDILGAYGASTSNTGMNLQALNELIGLSMPQNVSAYNPGQRSVFQSMLPGMASGLTKALFH